MEVLPFTEAMQEAVLGHCIIHEDFFLKCLTNLKSPWFSANVLLSSVFEQMVQYHAKHKSPPLSFNQLLNEHFFLSQDPKEQAQFKNCTVRCAESAKTLNLDRIQQQLTGFIQVSLFKEAMTVASQKFNRVGLDDAYYWVKNELDKIEKVSFTEEKQTMPFDNTLDWLAKSREQTENAISTGNKLLDSAIGGGLFKCEASAFMAPANIGKTSAMVTIMRHALVNRQYCLFVSHEGNPSKLKKKIIGSIVGLSPFELDIYIGKVGVDPLDPERDFSRKRRLSPQETLQKYNWAVSMVMEAEKLLSEYLVFLPFIKTGAMFLEDVVSDIKRLNQTLKSKNGRGFDLIIDDYPKRLRTKHRTKDGIYRVELAETYDTFNQLSVELNNHCLVAIQTNRAGAKMNKGTLESDFYLGLEEVDEAYGIAQNMPTVITLNRSPDDASSKVLHYCIAKNRDDRTNIVVTTRTDYARTLLHGDQEMFKEFGRHIGEANQIKGLASYYREDSRIIATSAADILLTEIESGKQYLAINPKFNGGTNGTQSNNGSSQK